MIEVHIITNCSKIGPPSTDMILKTYNSFCKAFKTELIPIIWCDPNPYTEKYKEYKKNLQKHFPVINKTGSQAESYVSAIKTSNKRFLFMLEHDWEFYSENISHSLDEIILVMKQENLYHLRFNKRDNTRKGCDKPIEEKNYNGFKYCITPCLSNNPHIIDKEYYIKNNLLKFIKIKKGKHKIEGPLSKNPDLFGAIYGPLGHPKTIEHLDGRGIKK